MRPRPPSVPLFITLLLTACSLNTSSRPSLTNGVAVSPQVVQLGGSIPFRKFYNNTLQTIGGMAIGNSRIWLTDGGRNQVGYALPGGGEINMFLLPQGSYSFSITEGADHNMWFADRGANSIGVVATSGNISEYSLPTPRAGLLGIVAAPDLASWFTEEAADKIGRIDTKGQITEYALPGGMTPYFLTVGADGNLWVCTSSNIILRVTTAGGITSFSAPSCDLPTLASDGRVYASSNSAKKLIAISKSGTIATIDTGYSCRGLQEIDGILYCLDSNNWSAIQRFDIATQSNLAPLLMPDWFSHGELIQGITVGPDGNLWFGLTNSVAVYLRRLLTVSPKFMTVAVGSQKNITASETNFTGSLAAFSQQPSIATVQNGSGEGSFVVTGVAAGSTIVVIDDRHYNSFQVRVTVK